VRVTIDARPAADPHRTGVGMYAEALLRHLPPAMPEDRFLAWYLDVRGIGRRPRRFAAWAPNLRERASRIPSRLFGPFASRTGLPKVEWLAGASDVVVATNYLPPPTTSDGVVLVVHDLAFAAMPETAPHHDARWRRAFARRLREAAAVIVPSRATYDDLLATHDVEAGKVHVVLHGTDADRFAPVTPVEVDAMRGRLGIAGPYIAFLGGLEPQEPRAPRAGVRDPRRRRRVPGHRGRRGAVGARLRVAGRPDDRGAAARDP